MLYRFWWKTDQMLDAFYMEVGSVKEAELLFKAFYGQDLHLRQLNIITKNAESTNWRINAGGLQYWDEAHSRWLEYHNEAGLTMDHFITPEILKLYHKNLTNKS